MNTEQLNDIMNCDCLQNIIENDKKRYTYTEDRFGCKATLSTNDGFINFNTIISYRVKKTQQL
jgi:hypothetical protein